MTEQHLITPLTTLGHTWIEDWHRAKVKHTDIYSFLITQAAQWGADQELEACCEWLEQQTLCGHRDLIPSLHAARRPKPPSLKEQALEEVGVFEGMGTCNIDIIRRALESLPD